MNRKTVNAAVDEAHRFIRRAKDYAENAPDFDFVGTKESGALRRASLDLTRALSAMRRPG